MKYITLTLALIGTLAFSGLLVGCEEEGPAERMGESMDEAGEEIRESMDEAGDGIREGIDDATD